MGEHRHSKTAYEKYLNDFYSENYNEEDIVDQLSYLTKNRSAFIIRKAYWQRKLGSMLRRRDPIAFNVGYQEWLTKQKDYKGKYK